MKLDLISYFTGSFKLFHGIFQAILWNSTIEKLRFYMKINLKTNENLTFKETSKDNRVGEISTREYNEK